MFSRAVVLAALLACASSARGEELLVLDIDAEYVSDTECGAIFSIRTTDPPTTAPVIVARDAPMSWGGGLACRDSDHLIAEDDVGPPSGRLPIVNSKPCGRPLATQRGGAPFVLPFGASFRGDGRLLIADADSDPAGLGRDPGGGAGPGAIWSLDLDACPACAPVLVSDGTLHGFGAGVRTAFADPFSLEWDGVRGLVYVVDPLSTAGAATTGGRLFSVDPATGFVRLVSASPSWIAANAVTVRNDGTPLVVDEGTGSGDSSLWEIDLSNGNPATNARRISGGAQYGQLQDVAVGAAGDVYLSDWGVFDSTSGTFLSPPAIFRVDEGNPDPDANAVVVSESVRLISPIALCVARTPCRVESDCANAADDDGDGLADCADPDCEPACPENCSNGVDDDADTLVDCEDPECAGPSCPEICRNGLDDDGDGRADCDDSDCFGPGCPEVCGSGLDEDGDGFTDCDDVDCVGPSCPEVCGNARDDDGDGLADCDDDDCIGAACPEGCTNGRDDDGDNLIDCADPDCVVPSCPEDCTDGRDDDGDFLSDCDDPDCASGAPCPRLAIDRAMTSLDVALVAAQFSCANAPFAVCVEQIVPGDAATGLTLPGEALPTGASGLRFYEHSDAVVIRVRSAGGALVVGE